MVLSLEGEILISAMCSTQTWALQSCWHVPWHGFGPCQLRCPRHSGKGGAGQAMSPAGCLDAVTVFLGDWSGQELCCTTWIQECSLAFCVYYMQAVRGPASIATLRLESPASVWTDAGSCSLGWAGIVAASGTRASSAELPTPVPSHSLCSGNSQLE